jgi:hypothetical protein
MPIPSPKKNETTPSSSALPQSGTRYRCARNKYPGEQFFLHAFQQAREEQAHDERRHCQRRHTAPMAEAESPIECA